MLKPGRGRLMPVHSGAGVANGRRDRKSRRSIRRASKSNPVPFGCVRPLSLFHSDASADGVEVRSASQAERLGRSCLSIARSALSLARSAQAKRDNVSCFFQTFSFPSPFAFSNFHHSTCANVGVPILRVGVQVAARLISYAGRDE
ncbi:hypothetical protein EVAR_25417_1 [Eumeta japonica]|uniref:Uncharacterized protein n=1 Tax=Eumeta variegata TaxID=151549 RepID=A0A4C1V610_EUMVA|nr:hypothetical protein EVAR_25417_1 [Eumeta japonica]